MSTLKITTLADLAGNSCPALDPIKGSARAWVNFNNGGGTLSIVKAYNCSSVSDWGVGDFVLNMTSALLDTSYAVVGCNAGATLWSNTFWEDTGAAKTTTSVRVGTGATNASVRYDWGRTTVVIFD